MDDLIPAGIVRFLVTARRLSTRQVWSMGTEVKTVLEAARGGRTRIHRRASVPLWGRARNLSFSKFRRLRCPLQRP